MADTFNVIWQNLLARLKPGEIVRNWTVAHEYLGDEMLIKEVNTEKIVVQAPNAVHLQHISKNEFEAVWQLWPGYIESRVQRQQILELTRHSKYIISIFHWVEEKS